MASPTVVKRHDPRDYYGVATTPEAREAIDEMIAAVTAAIINRNTDDDMLAAISKVGESKDDKGGERFAAFIAGIHSGSVMVAREWVRSHPLSVIGWYAQDGRSKRPSAQVIPFAQPRP